MNTADRGPHVISARVDRVLNVVFAIFAAAVLVIAAVFVLVLTLQLALAS